VLATEDQGCPAGWQANPSTKGGRTEDYPCPQQQQHLEGG
jgi:hypothetical protein